MYLDLPPQAVFVVSLNLNSCVVQRFMAVLKDFPGPLPDNSRSFDISPGKRLPLSR